MLLTGFVISLCTLTTADTIYVSPQGKDSNPGSKAQPLATVGTALRRKAKTIVLREGVYELNHYEDVVSACTIKSEKGERAVVSGAKALKLDWRPYRDGIWQASFNDGKLALNRVWLNGRPLHRARYPNVDPKARHLGGTAADALSPARIAKWEFPNSGLVHAMHSGLWGDQWFRIVGKKADGSLQLSAPIGNNRPSGLHPELRYVENIFEELDAPGEWFERNGTLYIYPPDGVDMRKATCEVSATPILFRVANARNVRFEGVTFTKTASTFLDANEPLLRSDWKIARRGAVMLTGTENSTFVDCDFLDLGGNGIFVSGKNRGTKIERCHFADLGASAVCFVGDPKAVRNPLLGYPEKLSLTEIDPTPGPQTDDYPIDGRVEDSLIERIGLVEKQSVGVQISMSRRITVKNTTIHDCPRAGINIGDGCWGGHVIEGCDVFDTVRETSDHGAFNSWGRDRFWNVSLGGKPMPPDMPKWDAMETTVLRGNRWQCSHGWDIDLDDGSSNYLIENNLCLEGGLKLREGYFRTARNNILVNNGLHLHVWYPGSRDVVERNLTYRGHAGPVGMPSKWGDSVDANFVHRPGAATSPAKEMQAISHADQRSLVGDALFVDAAREDWRIAPNSPALNVGFRPFPLDRFGVQKGRLREAARRAYAQRPRQGTNAAALDQEEHTFLGGRVKNLSGISEVSSTGMHEETGVLVLEAPAGSSLATLGLRRQDVILGWGRDKTARVKDLMAAAKKESRPALVTVWRGQGKVELRP